MSWLVALVAFAGIMAVFSTVVTVVVEAYHKALSLRRSGLEEMLRSVHLQVIGRIDQTLPENDPRALVRASGEFAKAMTSSPAYGGQGRWWWPANWRLNISQRRFEHLSKRQLAEQLAMTDFGKRLVMADRMTIQRVMGEVAYQFDRIGAAQSDYFRRRAKVISGLFAFAFVAAGNINALDVYQHLASSEASSGQVIALVERIAAEGGVVLPEAGPAASPDSLSSASYLEAVARLQASSQLPIGRAYFPFCEGLEPAGGGAWQRVDMRCQEPGARLSLWVMDPQYAVSVPSVVGNALARPASWIVWLMSVIATAGLLGLGAPFWFDVFNRAAALAGRQVTQAKALSAEEESRSRPSRPGLRGGEDADAGEMADALLMAGGQAHRCGSAGPDAPSGLRLGPASADRVRPSGSPASQEMPRSLRPAPGAVKGTRG